MATDQVSVLNTSNYLSAETLISIYIYFYGYCYCNSWATFKQISYFNKCYRKHLRCLNKYFHAVLTFL